MIEFHQIIITVLSILLAGFLFTGSRRRVMYVLYKTLPRDIIAAYRFFQINILLWWWEKREYTVPKLFAKYAAANPKKIAYIFEDKKWTYEELDHFSNRIGRYFRTRSFSHYDCIAVIMENSPEYIGTWLGLTKAGLVAALINTNLRHDTLLHSINAAGCKAIIFGSEFKDAIRDIKNKIPDIELYQWSESDTSVLEETIDLNNGISNIDPAPLIVQLDYGSPRDKLLYIYTSGTTGMPKAAIITNLRYMLITCLVNSMLGLRSNDRLYNTLPLFHSAGGIIGAGQALLRGVTVVLRRRFSVSKFWSDCIHYECTVAIYIGEICRFLLMAPPSQNDRKHKIRLMFGNGLRPQIWESFVKRFGIKQIGEYYGATEGNSNLINVNNKTGAIGFLPRYIPKDVYPAALLKIDEKGNLLRGTDGLCIPCKPGEPGIFVGKINSKKAINNFDGYTDKKASEQKIIHDVFKKGDRTFNSGDILVMDEFGYFYFKDRTGDTFRWRGENVATSEVEAIISNVIGFKDATVYGVEIPGNEGKAGMVAIYDDKNSLNLEEFADKLKKVLPSYARPRFIRILSELPMTGTYKLKKKDLQQDAFDIKKVKDPIYFLNNDTYVKLTDKYYNDIIKEKIQL